jgi:hypothetical protein
MLKFLLPIIKACILRIFSASYEEAKEGAARSLVQLKEKRSLGLLITNTHTHTHTHTHTYTYTYTISYFSQLCNKTPGKNNLRVEGLSLAHNFRDFHSQSLAPMILGPQ